jgi:hypothetical protein
MSARIFSVMYVRSGGTKYGHSPVINQNPAPSFEEPSEFYFVNIRSLRILEHKIIRGILGDKYFFGYIDHNHIWKSREDQVVSEAGFFFPREILKSIRAAIQLAEEKDLFEDEEHELEELQKLIGVLETAEQNKYLIKTRIYPDY